MRNSFRNPTDRLEPSVPAKAPHVSQAIQAKPALQRTPAAHLARMQGQLQLPMLAAQAKQDGVVQCAKCLECGHNHGSARCHCGCTSHSSHWGKGAKFNPGAGKHDRMIARMGGGGAAGGAGAGGGAGAAGGGAGAAGGKKKKK